ncbi:hypothetical protein AR690_15230, partial [Leptospira interrogans serovar Lai]
VLNLGKEFLQIKSLKQVFSIRVSEKFHIGISKTASIVHRNTMKTKRELIFNNSIMNFHVVVPTFYFLRKN